MDLQLQREIREMKVGHRSKGELCHTLEGMLQAMNVTGLRKLGNMYGIVGFSRMAKQTLIPYIWQQMTRQHNMETMLRALDELNWAFFKKAVQQREHVDDEALPSDYMLLVRIGILGVYEVEGRTRYVIPEAIKVVYNQLQQNGFVQRLERENLLRKYADAAVNLYGIIRKNDFIELFNQYNERKTNIQEIDATLKDGKRYYQRHEPWQNYLVNRGIAENSRKYFIEITEGKPRYIPDKDEFLKYREWEYYEQTPQAAALEEQLHEHTGDSKKAGHIMTGFMELHRHNVVL